MKFRFTKMHGCGNDFVVIDAISQRIKLTPERIQQISDRRFGVGCDQVLIVEVPQNPEADFRYRIYNADGSEVENCGNGARCFARFVSDRRLTGKRSIVVETSSGKMTLLLQDNGEVTVDMGQPILDPAAIPVNATEEAVNYQAQTLSAGDVSFSAVSMGNPHAVISVTDTDTAPVDSLGPEMESHPLFPKRVNVGFMQVISTREISLRVFERGVGETLACGTGACAAVVSGRLQNRLDEQVTVHLRGGDLSIQWQGLGHSVFMTGPAVTVFHGQITL